MQEVLSAESGVYMDGIQEDSERRMTQDPGRAIAFKTRFMMYVQNVCDAYTAWFGSDV